MELRHLRYFLAVADELHFGRAARQLHISQPPLSKQIHQLEEEIGINLFHRTSRKVELTAAGQIFAGETRLLLQQLENAATMAIEAAREKGNQLVVGYSPGIIHIMIRILKAFAKRHEKILVLVKNMETVRQIEALHNGRLDIAIVTLRLALNTEGLTIETILKDRLIVAMPVNHPLSSCRRIPLRTLSNVTLILDPLHKNQARHGPARHIDEVEELAIYEFLSAVCKR